MQEVKLGRVPTWEGPSVQTSKAMESLALGRLLRICALTPTPCQGELLCRFTCSHVCAALRDPICDFFLLGEGRERELFPPLMGDEVLKRAIWIPTKYFSEHGVLNKKAEGKGLLVVVLYY